MSENWFEHPQYIPPEKIEITEAQGVSALRFAWKEIYGEFPSDNSLGILFAQTCLETGRFKAGFHNFNVGHIKATLSYINLGGEHYFTMFEAGEIIGGKEFIFKPPHIQTFFRAYKTLIDGCKDYILFLSQRSRYKKAWAELIKGDPRKYCFELKAAGYFTAGLERYTAGVVRLFEEFHRRKTELLSWDPEKLAPKKEETSDSLVPHTIENTSEDREDTTLPPPSKESKKEIIIPPSPKPPVINVIEKEESTPDFRKKEKAKGIATVIVLAVVGFMASWFQGCQDFFSGLF